MSEILFHIIRQVPSGKSAVKKTFVGSWRVSELEGYDAEYIDLCGPAKLKIAARGNGSMNFGAVCIELDCKMDDLDERVLRFSFEGEDEGDQISGRGYCLVEGDQMTGRIFRYFSDEFAFKAKRLAKSKKA